MSIFATGGVTTVTCAIPGLLINHDADGDDPG